MELHFMVVLLFLLLFIMLSLGNGTVNSSCMEMEREALLTFRNSLKDPSNRLSSWVGYDCCNWAGVGCDNITGHVVTLKLNNPYISGSDPYGNRYPDSLPYHCDENCLVGTEVNPSLIDLVHLRYLDLSFNNFTRNEIPQFIGNFKELTYLNLSYANFAGTFPYSVGNISTLIELDLRGLDSRVDTLQWLSHLSKLQYLDLSFIDLGNDMLFGFEVLNLLPSLSELFLEHCRLHNVLFSSFSLYESNFTNLQTLDLSQNGLSGIIPTSLCALTTLSVLDLSSNHFNGQIPTCIGEMRLLERVNLSGNKLSGTIPTTLCTLSSIRELHLSTNNFHGLIPTCLGKMHYFEEIDLSGNELIGSIPTSFCSLTTLRELWLSRNQLNGSIPTCTPGWWRSLSGINLGSNQLSGLIPPTLATLSSSLSYLDFGNNRLTGHIPWNIGDMPNLIVLDLANNRITGSIPTSLFEIRSIRVINLSNNHLSGDIRRKRWSTVPSNSITGTCVLESLRLSNNTLYGELPSLLKNCSLLRIIDIGKNRFSGKIPSWIKQLSTLEILKLRSNKFEGALITELCIIENIRILDLAHNEFTGFIPGCFGNFAAMKLGGRKQEVSPSMGKDDLTQVMKGKELEYTSTLRYLVNIDLSSNALVGWIPNELTTLSGLHGLHLSNNQLTEEIPKTMGSLISLESLDFSLNHLSGMIPQSLSWLTSLSYLNLSYNNLSGPIPTGTQLQTFDRSMFEGNQNLCGAQIEMICTKDESFETNNDDGRVNEKPWFYIGVMAGFVVGFGEVCGILFFKKTWRYKYFRLVENALDKLIAMFMVCLSQPRKQMRDVTRNSVPLSE